MARKKKKTKFLKKSVTFRKEIINLHRAIFKQNQATINTSVFGFTPLFRKYEREYYRAVSSYRQTATFKELDKALAHVQIAYVGDYHTLTQAQRTFLRLLRRLPESRSVCVALEFVAGRHQTILDSYQRGELSEEEFLQGIAYERHWGFGGWENFREILALAKNRNYQVIGIDMASHGPAGASLVARDNYAARRINKSAISDPNALVMVLMGELHVAPNHLPFAVQKIAKLKTQRPKHLIIYQNCHEIYWQLEERGLEHEVELVQIAEDQYCIMDTPPIICQQSFLNWLDVDQDGPQLEAPERNFKEFARIIANFFSLPLLNALEEVEITTVIDLSFLERLRKRGDFSEKDMRFLHKQILNSESYTIPRANMVYLGNLSVNHAAEEATHFLRHACVKQSEPKLLVDAFYLRCLEEAIGFLGSKLINHKRKCTPKKYFERQTRSTKTTPFEKNIARLILKHLRMEKKQPVRGMRKVYECDIETFNAVTHVLGYWLGEKLYYGLVKGNIEKEKIQNLFFETFPSEGEATLKYFLLLSDTERVKIPDRF